MAILTAIGETTALGIMVSAGKPILEVTGVLTVILGTGTFAYLTLQPDGTVDHMDILAKQEDGAVKASAPYRREPSLLRKSKTS